MSTADTALSPLPRRATTRLTSLWTEMALPATARRVPGTVPVGIAAALIAFAAAAYVVPHGWNLAYSDAQSHLTFARLLFDTRNLFSTSGTAWLPIAHLLLAPFVLCTWAWHTGWGAAILGAGCLGITASGLYRSAARWGAGRAARLVTVAAVAVNPTMLYLTSTALTEPVLIAAMAACLAGLATFANRGRLSSPGEVAVFAGLPAAIAVLSRYEGWALAIAGACFVLVAAWRRTHLITKTLNSGIGFAVPPLLAMLTWMTYNEVAFGDPFGFATGEFSTTAHPTEIVATGTTRGNLAGTINTLNLAVTTSVGWVLLILAVLGLIAALTILRARNRILYLCTAASSYLFLVVALFVGQTVMWNDALAATSVVNNRFGMASILPAALLAGLAVDALPTLLIKHGRFRLAKIATPTVAGLAVVALLGQAGWVMQAPTVRSLTLAEAADSMRNGTPSRQAADWLAVHYTGGGILIDETTWSNVALPQAGIPLHEYYLHANDASFRQAVADPARHVNWVWVSQNSNDPVTRLSRTPAFRSAYHVAYTNPRITIYTRNEG